MKTSATLAAVLAAASATSAQSYTTIILTEPTMSTTTIVLPAWPTTWTTTTPTLTGYPETVTTTPATVPTAGAESMMVLDRAAMGSLVLFVILGLIAV